MSDQRIPLDADNSRAWTEVAHGTRLHWQMLENVGEPRGGSKFVRLHEIYPYEQVADRSRAYVYAALEHLMLWAEVVAPLKFHPEQASVFQQRPPYTLARASLEAAAQAVWMLDTTDPIECVRRHLCLIRWDLQEHRRSVLEPEQKSIIDERETELLRRVTGVIPESEIRPPRGYLAVIKLACESVDLDLEPQQVDRLWRAASGSAHGMFWPTLELQHELELTDAAGAVQRFRIPDANGITEVLGAGYKMTQLAVLKYAEFAGADTAMLIANAMQWLVERVPLKPDADAAALHPFRPIEPRTGSAE